MKTIRNHLVLAASLMASLSALAQSAIPGITRQPSNQSLYIGGNAVFSIIATGSPPPTYQWRFNGHDLSGKTTSVFNLGKLSFTNAGAYSVMLSNEAGSVTSEAGWLSVLPTNVINLGDSELRFGKLSADPVWEAAHIDDEGQTVTGDGLTVFYGSRAPGGLGNQDIWMVKRPTLTSAWGAPANLGPTVNSAAVDTGPRLSPDGLSLYFDSTRAGGRGGYDIWVTTRPSADAPFGAPVNLGPAINSSFDDGIGDISADNRTLVFASLRPGDPGANNVWLSTRTNALVPWEPASRLPAPINSSSGGTFPVALSRDGLLLFIKSWRSISAPAGANVTAAIYVCRRTNMEQPFGSPVLIRSILAVGSHGADDCSISDDGTTLYVGTYRTTYPDWPQLVQIDITPLPQLTAQKWTAIREFQFVLMGREGANYEIQVSSDLKTWDPWLTTNTPASVVLSDPTSTPEGRRFYRALSH